MFFRLKGLIPTSTLKNIEFHLLDTEHFALEEDGDAIANHIAQFLTSRLQPIFA